MTKDEALKLALEALEAIYKIGDVACVVKPDGEIYLQPVILKCRKALAQPEQDGKCKYCTDGCPACDARKLPQRTWVGLTDEEIEVIEALKAPPVHPDFIDCDDWMDFARAIEFKLKEKNELR